MIPSLVRYLAEIEFHQIQEIAGNWNRFSQLKFPTASYSQFRLRVSNKEKTYFTESNYCIERLNNS